MLILTNKLCERLPFENVNLADIKVKSKINDMTYMVSVGDTKGLRKINFNTPKNADKEYPLLIVVDSKFKRLLCQFDEKHLHYRDVLFGATICFNKKYPIKLSMLKAKFKVFKANVVLFFKKLWYAGLLNKQVICDDKLYVKTSLPDFYNNYSILKSVNETYDKILKFEKTIQETNTKKYALKWLELADKL